VRHTHVLRLKTDPLNFMVVSLFALSFVWRFSLCLLSLATKSCDVRLDLFGYRLWKIPDCCNHFAMACMTIQLPKQSHLKPNEANEG
jgi:hypothetical protein